MKRKIKFRGIDTMSGEMVYGDLVQQELTDGSITTAIVQTYATYDVKPETVGQFTGMHDKNGVEIYEGDIVHTEFDTPFGLAKYTGDIFYNINGFDLNIHKVEGEENEGEGVLMLGTDTSGLVVVGNIYENKED